MKFQMEKFCLVVPPNFYRAGWKAAKDGSKDFKIEKRKLYFMGARVYKTKLFAV